MWGEDERGVGLFSYIDLEARVPADPSVASIRIPVDKAVAP